MGRHHLKLPDHLYLSPPAPSSPAPPSTSALSSASSFFSSKARPSYSSSAFFSETTTTTRAIENRIPGFKTSAAFFTALRANIDLQIESLESPANTPDSLRPIVMSSPVPSLPTPSPLVQAAMGSDSGRDDDGLAASSAPAEPEQDGSTERTGDADVIPDLTTFAATDETSRIEALRLVADSVAQQRQRANRALIFHPATIAVLAVVLGLLQQYFYKGATSDYAIMGTTFAGVLMAALVSIRAVTGAYIEEAEKVGTWSWLGQGREAGNGEETSKKALGESDEILVTKFGENYIGAIIFRGVQPVDESSNKKSRKAQSSHSKTEIRGWTVRQRYRGKGVGTALLEDAIRISHERGWANGGIEIAADHANSKSVLPAIFSGFVHTNERRARSYLTQKVEEYLDANAGSRGGKKKR